MIRLLFAAALALLAGCSGCSTVPHVAVKPATVRLDFPSGVVCSATAVGEYTLLTAAHCFRQGAGEVNVSGRKAGFVIVASDEKDHVLVRVTARQAHIAQRGMARQGDVVFVHGNPGGLADVLRFGRVASVQPDGTLLVDANNYKGDSGGAIFNERGQIVGVVTGVSIREWFTLTVALPIAFTAAQWAEVV